MYHRVVKTVLSVLPTEEIWILTFYYCDLDGATSVLYCINDNSSEKNSVTQCALWARGQVDCYESCTEVQRDGILAGYSGIRP